VVEELEPTELAQRMKSDPRAVFLLDVREEWERAQAVIEPSLHIPMQELAGRVAELPTDRPIVVYCHMGTRSAMVAGFLERHGFPTVANLSGGIDQWSTDVDPDIPRY
jgi:rhodanese-related sulfurtransferase